MGLLSLGINYETAPLAIRERVAFPLAGLRTALQTLLQTRCADHPTTPLVRGAVILSTCNRTELYCATAYPSALKQWLAHYHQLPYDTLAPYLYTYPNEEAVRHAFRVASGLNSAVLGEPQILGQVKQAVSEAQQAGSLDSTLHRLFQHTLTIAKHVRTYTEIGNASVSMASAIVKLAQNIFPSLQEQHVLLVGAGEMIELVATHLAAHQPKTITIANRNPERAQLLAARIGAKVIGLADIPESLPHADVLVSCTASTLPLIGKGAVERAIRLRKHRPILMVDLAVPRDIEPEVQTLEDIFLYTVDDLAAIIRRGLTIRQSAVSEAESLIEMEVHRFVEWQQQRATVPLIHALQEQASGWQEQAMKRALKRLGQGADPHTVLHEFSHNLTQKWMHPLMSILRTEASIEWSARLGELYKLNPRDERETLTPLFSESESSNDTH